MSLSISEQQQQEMRYAHYDGAPGVLISALVWIAAALVCQSAGMRQGVWTLLIGGAWVYPVGAVLTKALGRPAKTDKGNALNQLAAASTIWLILACITAYGLYLFKPAWFFPAMMATIGSRYLVFASVYGVAAFWVLGIGLIGAAALALFVAIPPPLAAGLGGCIEAGFALWLFMKAAKPAARQAT